MNGLLKIERNKTLNIAKAINGVAVMFISCQPNSVELELQFIKKPEVKDAKATKPKTQKSFNP